MRYDVFLSYSRGDGDENAASVAECRRVLRIVKDQMKLHTFVDLDEMEAGRDWIDQCQAILTSDFKPTVVLLATARAAASESVRKEIEFAKSKHLDIVPLEYDQGASTALLGNERLHHLQPRCDDVALERQLRIALTRRIAEFLDEQQRLAQEWCNRVQPLDRESFWEGRWKQFFGSDNGRPKSVAITARGGSGKSFLIAHLVRDLIRRPTWYPVIVQPAQLQADALQQIVRALGARSFSDLPEHLGGLAAERELNVVFVVDGLDRAPARAAEIAPALNGLIGAAPTIIGCRDGVWAERFRGMVSIEVERLEPLDAAFVQSVLRKKAPHLAGRQTPLLTVPFFLDLVLQNSNYWRDIPQTETGFLAEVWKDVAGPKHEIVPKSNLRPRLLDVLALLQLEHLRYDVPRAEVLADLASSDEAEEQLRALENEGVLVDSTDPLSPGERTIRLRHDHFDNYSMSRLLVHEGREDDRRKLYGRIAIGCGWSVVSALLRQASDRGLDEVVDEAFDHILFVLDQKDRQEDHWSNQAWAATYVLKECFVPLMPRILECLRACKTGSPAEWDKAESSRKAPRLTQVAASTLTSAFSAIGRGTIQQADDAVPVLRAILENDKWLHGRAIEALAKFFDTREALLAVVRFGEQQLRARKDLPSLEYVAKVLRGKTDPQAEALLRAIYDDPGLRELFPRAVRLAAIALNEAHPGCVPVPEPNDAEVIKGLQITTTRLGKTIQTDWAVVQEYAEMVAAIVSRGTNPFGPGVLDALIGALGHPQIFVRSPVADCLGWFDERRARDALLDELLEPEVPAEVLSSCVGALRRQIGRQPGAAERQLRRVLALRAAMTAEARQKVSIAKALRSAVLDPLSRLPDDWLIDGDSAEVVGPGEGPASGICRFTAVPEDEAPLTPPFDAVVNDEHRAAAGAAFEPKYRVAGVRRDDDGALLVALAPTTWELGRGFHTVARSSPGKLAGRGGAGWPEPIPLGDDRLPGIAVVHVVVVTSDRRLLLAQRSRNVGYSPGCWSVSFEEQITRSDLDAGGDAAANAARRGFREEFGEDLDPGRAFSLTAILEIPILNAAVVTLFECPHTAAEIAERWAREPRPTHHFEADAVSSVELSDAALHDLVSGAGQHKPLHPSSSMRVALVRRFLQRTLEGDAAQGS